MRRNAVERGNSETAFHYFCETSQVGVNSESSFHYGIGNRRGMRRNASRERNSETAFHYFCETSQVNANSESSFHYCIGTEGNEGEPAVPRREEGRRTKARSG